MVIELLRCTPKCVHLRDSVHGRQLISIDQPIEENHFESIWQFISC